MSELQSKLLAGFLFSMAESLKNLKDTNSFSSFSMCYENRNRLALVRDLLSNKNSAEGVIAPAGAKFPGATIRTWLLNKFISFLAVLTWKTGLKKM